jgi:NAD(P)-dependent dehydrogenase (short-subunit alcohol dehydrogenase family)
MLTEAARVEYAGSGLHFTCVMPSFTATDLIAGTKGTRFIGTVSPEQVGQAIAKATVKRSKDVWVPGSLGPTVKVQQILGRRVRDAMGRALGADKTFIELDAEARAIYADRVSREAGN